MTDTTEGTGYAVTYVGTLGHGVDLPTLGWEDVQHGETVPNVPPDDFVAMCEQVSNWVPADERSKRFFNEFLRLVDGPPKNLKALSKPELVVIATAAGIDDAESKTKPELVAALEQHEGAEGDGV